MRGRKPKPTAVKRLLGNPGHRPMNAAEPIPTGRPIPPVELDGRAAVLWSTQVANAWWLTGADSFTAYMWACLAAEFERDPAGMQAARISQLRGLSSALGFDPTSRSRLAGDKPPEVDSVDRFFSLD